MSQTFSISAWWKCEQMHDKPNIQHVSDTMMFSAEFVIWSLVNFTNFLHWTAQHQQIDHKRKSSVKFEMLLFGVDH